MLNLIHDHPDEGVRTTAIRFLDALTRWNRNTGRENVVIIKDTTGCQWRSLSGTPQLDDISDAQLLEAYARINEQHNTGADR